MPHYADLELSLHRLDATSYQVDFRFSQPESDADIRLSQGEQARAVFDLAKLSELLYDPDEYSAELTRCLFGSESLRMAFAQARTSAQSQNAALRLRLFIGASAPELHGLRWELLRDPSTVSPTGDFAGQAPQSGVPLATDANILFSRYLASLDWRPVRLKPRGELKALVVVSASSDLKNYRLAEIDRDAEVERAERGLGEINMASRVAARATINELVAELREFAPDVLYLVAHGYLVNGQPLLVLEDDEGKVERVQAIDLVTRFRELESLPRLVVLISCQSGGKPGENSLAALGPRLAEIGIPAVLAMQDNLSLETAAKFMPEFFKELAREGQIDRAVSVARGMVRERPDAWVPALTTRLKSGRLWYTPGVSENGKSFEKFPAILQAIRLGRCTPILGAGLTEPLFGSLRDIARRWAEQFHYPMMPHERESLPQVAQYLTVQQSPQFPYDELEEVLKGHIRKLRTGKKPPAVDTLEAHIQTLGSELRQSNLNEAHKLLAELPLPVYITTNADSLLEDALREAGKQPESMLCPWNEYLEQLQADLDLGSPPTIEHPLVFHLFGRWDEPDSLVLTEDNYFDFLIGRTEQNNLIPEYLRQRLSDSGLLFLGFQTEEWNFRVLYRSILAQKGRARRRRYTHIAAQIEPEDDRILEPARARRYLEQYFSGSDVSIYWGSPGDFMGELLRQWREAQA
jgi:hypothetical protein